MYNRRLETFLCAADAGCFNKASEELYITPTAVIIKIDLLGSAALSKAVKDGEKIS